MEDSAYYPLLDNTEGAWFISVLGNGHRRGMPQNQIFKDEYEFFRSKNGKICSMLTNRNCVSLCMSVCMSSCEGMHMYMSGCVLG